MKTYCAREQDIEKNWYVLDASKYNFGRMSAKIAHYLRGKHKPQYTPHADTGDFIIVINADKLCSTGKKMKDKIYYKHSGYPGGLKDISLENLIKKDSRLVIKNAVKGMMPHGPLGRQMLKKLKIFKGDQHNHSSQKPVILEL